MMTHDANMVQHAAYIATVLHAAQRRRYLGDAYIVHPARVAHAAMRIGLPVDAVAAAWLHDVVEDTPAGAGELLYFPVTVRNIVLALSRSRSQSSDDYMARILATPHAATLKVLDRADNLRDLVRAHASTLGANRESVRAWAVAYVQKTDATFGALIRNATLAAVDDLAIARQMIASAIEGI
jgi:(p)ppGpp synthase/HD superfamily hydrolase